MNAHQQVDLNQVGCIHEIHRWGETVYQNICTGTTVSVPWGSMDFFGGVMIIVSAATLGFVLLAWLWLIITD